MRVFFITAALLAVTSAACSDAPTQSNLVRRGSSAPTTTAAAAPAKSAIPGKPSSDAPTPTSTPREDAGAPSSTSTPAPAPAAPAGSCQNPKCLGAAGTCGCQATDPNGNLVVMGCQDGQCACQGGITDSTFDGDCNSGDDAQQLFFTNCQCQ